MGEHPIQHHDRHGSPTEYAAAGIMGWSPGSNQFVDWESRRASNVLTVLIGNVAEQSIVGNLSGQWIESRAIVVPYVQQFDLRRQWAAVLLVW